MILGKCVGSLLATLDRFATVNVSTFPPGVLVNLADTTKLLSDLFHDDTKNPPRAFETPSGPRNRRSFGEIRTQR